VPRKKKEFAVASGEPDKQDSGQQAANSSLNLVALCRKKAKKHSMRNSFHLCLVDACQPFQLFLQPSRTVAAFATPPNL
jgi:hypothetical protein